MGEEEETYSVSKKHMVLMFNMINVCAKRGAFQAEEFKVIGELHEYLKEVLKVEELMKSEEKKEEESA